MYLFVAIAFLKTFTSDLAVRFCINRATGASIGSLSHVSIFFILRQIKENELLVREVSTLDVSGSITKVF